MNVKFNDVLAYIPSRSSLFLMCLLNTDTAVTFRMLLSSLQVELTYDTVLAGVCICIFFITNHQPLL